MEKYCIPEMKLCDQILRNSLLKWWRKFNKEFAKSNELVNFSDRENPYAEVEIPTEKNPYMAKSLQKNLYMLIELNLD